MAGRDAHEASAGRLLGRHLLAAVLHRRCACPAPKACSTLAHVPLTPSLLCHASLTAGFILMSPAAKTPHPLRALGAMTRYVSYALLIAAAIRTK